MSQIKIVSGFVTDVPKTTLSPGNYGSFTFRIGVAGTLVRMTVLPVPPFESNDYVALAVSPAFLNGSSYVGLAYRNIGHRAPAHPASLLPASVGILLGFMGLMGIVSLALPSAPEAPLTALSLACLGAGVAGFVRFRNIKIARRLLAEWKPNDQ